MHRIIVIAHGHPALSVGGGELAAYNLFRAYRDHGAVEDACFVARATTGAEGALTRHAEREYLWNQRLRNDLRFRGLHVQSTLDHFGDLVRRFKPTFIHAHHYVHLGLEAFRVAKQVAPRAKLWLTLHEYLAICHHNGQMVKTRSLMPCHRATLAECVECFPGESIERFWMREHFTKRHFDLVDHFVAPSEFLKGRYVGWGLAADRISVLENGQDAALAAPPRPLSDGGRRNRFGFFGQITPYKGLDILLEGLAQLPRKRRKSVVLEIHAANLDGQSESFSARIERARRPLEEEGSLRWIGPYGRAELPARMAGVDWVVVPSVWWENSPLVIQEAFCCARPVLCSNIGGMAEKVRHGVDGLHVEVGNRLAWAEALAACAASADLWDTLRAGIHRPPSHAQVADAHLRLLGAAAAE